MTPSFWRGVRYAIIPSLILWALIIAAVAHAQTLPQTHRVDPPFCGILHDRNMECGYDLKFGPCTHYALVNYRALKARGRDPIYAVWHLPNGAWHMNVLFRAKDGVLYEADNRGIIVPATWARGELYAWEDGQRRWWGGKP